MSLLTPSQRPSNVAEPLPLLLDVEGVNKFIGPISRTTLLVLATKKKIETVSMGMKRGKRLFVTESILRWLESRKATTLDLNYVRQPFKKEKGEPSPEQ